MNILIDVSPTHRAIVVFFLSWRLSLLENQHVASRALAKFCLFFPTEVYLIINLSISFFNEDI